MFKTMEVIFKTILNGEQVCISMFVDMTKTIKAITGIIMKTIGGK